MSASKAAKSSLKNDHLKCHYCSQLHKLEVCKNFLDLPYAEKKRVVRSKRLCYRCLSGGQVVKDCRSKLTCSIATCKSSGHHTLLHIDPSPSDVNDVVCRAVSVPMRNVCLDIVPVRVSSGGVDVLTYALLNPGSSMSFCELGLIEKLCLSCNECVVETSVETLTTDKPEHLSSESFSFHVQSLDCTNVFRLASVVLIDQNTAESRPKKSM